MPPSRKCEIFVHYVFVQLGDKDRSSRVRYYHHHAWNARIAYGEKGKLWSLNFFGDAWNSYFVDMRSLANATRKPLQVNDNIGDIYSMKRSNSGFNWLYGFGRKINFSTESAQTKSWWVPGGFWVSVLRIQYLESNKEEEIMIGGFSSNGWAVGQTRGVMFKRGSLRVFSQFIEDGCAMPPAL